MQRKSICSRLIVCALVLAAIPNAAAADESSKLAPNWVNELPTVDAVRRTMPAGADENETALRQAAAFLVLKDVVNFFTGKSDFDLARAGNSVPGAARAMEYRKAGETHPGHPLGDVWKTSDSADFRRDVTARFLSPATQQAYLRGRAPVDTAQDTGRSPVMNVRQEHVAILAQLPSIETVKRDLVGAGERDTAARTHAALNWLAAIARHLYGGLDQASRYVDAAQDIGRVNPNQCSDEPGCDPASGVFSRFYVCESAYAKSREFFRSIVDKYVPAARQPSLLVYSRGPDADELRAALALPVGNVHRVGPPTGACTTAGQLESPYTDDGRIIDAPQAKAEPVARQLALADGQKARSEHIDMNVFGIPLGVPLKLPFCSTVGQPKRALVGSVTVSAQTCLVTNKDGSSTIHWADGSLPEWALYSLVTDIKEDVLVSVKIAIPSWPRTPTRTINGGIIDAIVDGSMQTGYENEMKRAPERAAKAQKQLETKYGPPTHSKAISYTSNGSVYRKTEKAEWIRPGLHVRYDPDAHEDTVLIEVESVFKTRERVELKQQAAEPTL